MKVVNFRMQRQIAFCLAVMPLAPVGASAATASQAVSAPGVAPSTEAASKAPVGQNAGHLISTTTPSPQTPSQQDSSPQTTSGSQEQPESPAQAADQTQQTGGAQTAQPQQQEPAPATMGTAAAPYEKQDGVSGSKPAGAAIAPGKQRRTRSFAIRIALLVGAAIAVGVVVAASEGSPSRAN